MMKTECGETVVFDKPRRSKSRQVSSRFFPSSVTPSIETGVLSSPISTLSPVRPKPRTSTNTRNHRSHDSGFISRLWPSSTPISTTSLQSSDRKMGTLADHLGNERLKEDAERKSQNKKADSMFLNRQRSCSEFNRFENERESAKVNHNSFFGHSMRFSGRSSTSSSSSSKSSPLIDDHILPGRLSVDENALRQKSFRRRSDSVSDMQDSESESSDIYSGTSFSSPITEKSLPASYMSSTVSSRKSNNPKSHHPNSSPKKSMIKNAMKRANSLTTHGSVMSKWALSPGRSGSPPTSVESKGAAVSFSSFKPPASPSRVKGVGNLLTMGLDLFKTKKSSSTTSSPLGLGTADTGHQLRLLHNRLVQWRYANARNEAVYGNIAIQAESNLLYASDSFAKLQFSVQQKKLQLTKEKLQMKLDLILHSQIKPLEAWGDVERQHLSAISMTKDCLHSVVCRVPLVEGAKVEPQSASIALRHASDLAASLNSMLSTFSPTGEKTVSILSELAEVAAQEKSMLEECMELFRIISTLEIQERSVKCNIVQLKLWQQQHQQEIIAA